MTVRTNGEQGPREDAILTVQELAARLKLPLSWVYDHCRVPNGLPHFKLGKYLRFRESDVRLWLTQQQRNGIVSK